MIKEHIKTGQKTIYQKENITYTDVGDRRPNVSQGVRRVPSELHSVMKSSPNQTVNTGADRTNPSIRCLLRIRLRDVWLTLTRLFVQWRTLLRCLVAAATVCVVLFCCLQKHQFISRWFIDAFYLRFADRICFLYDSTYILKIPPQNVKRGSTSALRPVPMNAF